MPNIFILAGASQTKLRILTNILEPLAVKIPFSDNSMILIQMKLKNYPSP